MSRVRGMLVVAFVLALGGGVVLGLAAGRRAPEAVGPPPKVEHSWLADQLHLNPVQRTQMEAIWSQFLHGPAQANKERRRAIEKERDGALLSLLTPEQRAEYDRMIAEYGARLAEVSGEREKGFRDTVERTKAILDADQRKKYEELMKSHDGDRGGPRGHWHDPRSRPATRPGTLSATPAATQESAR